MYLELLRHSVQAMTDSDTAEISSLLSKGQREWLRGNEDALGSPDRVVRSRIKQRMKQGVSDMALVFRSDKIDSEDVMGSVRDETSSPNEDMRSAVRHGEMSEEMVADAMDSAINQLEMASGTEVADFGLEDIITQVRKIKGQHGHLDDETVLIFAVAGAAAGLKGTGKTEKQVRQWIEHNWPSSELALDKLEKAEDMAGL